MDQKTESLSPFLPGTQIQFAWDSTSLGWLKTCPRLYQYSMIDGWRSKGNSVHLDFGLWYHSALELYDKHRSNQANHEEALHAVVRACMQWTWIQKTYRVNGENGEVLSPETFGPWESGHNLKTRETLIRSVIWYLEQFVNDTCETVQLATGKPAVELSFRMEMDWGPKAGRTQSIVKTGLPYKMDMAAGAINIVTEDGEGATIETHEQPYVLSGHLDRVVQFQGAYYVMD